MNVYCVRSHFIQFLTKFVNSGALPNPLEIGTLSLKRIVYRSVYNTVGEKFYRVVGMRIVYLRREIGATDNRQLAWCTATHGIQLL